jgi:hypothetical protein
MASGACARIGTPRFISTSTDLDWLARDRFIAFAASRLQANARTPLLAHAFSGGTVL